MAQHQLLTMIQMKREDNKIYIETKDVIIVLVVVFVMMWLFTSCNKNVYSIKRLDIHYFKEYHVNDSIIKDSIQYHNK